MQTLFNLGEHILATKNKKATTKQTTSQTKVTRIKATDGKVSSKKATSVATATNDKPEKVAKKAPKQARSNPFKLFIGYFKGAWYELRQVRWPNRKATWSLTAAVLAFSAIFTLLVLLLDALFKYLFELMLG